MTGAETFVAPAFLLFCRVGACLMLAPGFSSERIPQRARLYLALGVSIALTPALLETARQAVAGAAPMRLATLIASELSIGATLGLLARLYFLALETLATAIAMMIGLGNIFAQAINDSEPAPAFSAFIVFFAVTLLFVTDQHLEILRGLSLSYQTAPIAAAQSIDSLLTEVARVLTQAHLLALRIASPFLIFGLMVNLAFGFLNRMIPQAPIYFISAPFVIIVGLYGLYLAGPDFFTAFTDGFGDWLRRG